MEKPVAQAMGFFISTLFRHYLRGDSSHTCGFQTISYP